jgi:EAL domain-containing protein (putative c-di-GMP-specific phosphodiesterase class I)
VIVRSTIGLGHALNLKVVAEGIESASSWDVLPNLGCDLIQGYFVSKPLPAQEFTAWMATRALALDREPGSQPTILRPTGSR